MTISRALCVVFATALGACFSEKIRFRGNLEHEAPKERETQQDTLPFLTVLSTHASKSMKIYEYLNKYIEIDEKLCKSMKIYEIQ